MSTLRQYRYGSLNRPTKNVEFPIQTVIKATPIVSCSLFHLTKSSPPPPISRQQDIWVLLKKSMLSLTGQIVSPDLFQLLKTTSPNKSASVGYHMKLMNHQKWETIKKPTAPHQLVTMTQLRVESKS